MSELGKIAYGKAIGRRTIIKAAAAAGIAQVAGPFIITARGEEPVKIGLDNPLTGTYAALGKNELIGCQLAIEQINAKGGILGRQAELLVEDSTSGDAGTAVQKARKLIDRDKVELPARQRQFGAGAGHGRGQQREGRAPHRARRPHRCRHRHRPAIGTSSASATRRRWKPTRCAETLIKKCGKKWYYITPDYAFGHTLQAGLERQPASKFGGTKVGADLTPLGTTDFSSYLIKAQAANPDVIIFLQAGDDMVNALKQAVQFGLDKQFHLAGAQQELEVLRRPAARGADRHLGVRVVLEPARTCRTSTEFVAAITKKTRPACRRRAPGSASPRPGPARWRPNTAKSLEAGQDGQGAAGLQAAAGGRADAGRRRSFAPAQNQLMPDLYVGHAQVEGQRRPRICSR